MTILFIMRLITAFVYLILVSVFFGSSCVLFILVSGEQLHPDVPIGDNSSYEAEDIVGVNFSETENSSSGDIKNGILVEEITSSFTESVLSTIRPEKATEELLPAPKFKYAVSSEEVAKEADVTAVNKTAGEEGPGPPDLAVTGDIPSFSEWAKKQLEARGENGTSGNGNGAPSSGPSSGQSQGHGKGKKNYASPDCGAKVVGSNTEAVSSSSLLTETRDEYLLNPCTADIFVIVELCEPIQPQRIEIANFELFSSSPREISVFLSDYPSREWTMAARIEAKDERTIQSFALPHLPQFVKFIRLELHSHYGTEHFCPLSLFRVYGTSEYEVLETVDSVGEVVVPEVEEEPPVVIPDLEEPKNLFGSAKAAVLSLVKRAAEVLVVKSPSRTGNNSCQEGVQPSQFTDHCITPSYLLICDNCSDQFFYRVYNLVCCQQGMLKSLMESKFVMGALERSGWCSRIGFDTPTIRNSTVRQASRIARRFRPKTTPNTKSPRIDYISALLSPETLAALCNMMAVTNRKVVLNLTSEEPSPSPVTKDLPEEAANILVPLPMPVEEPLKEDPNITTAPAVPESLTPDLQPTGVSPSPVVPPSTTISPTTVIDIPPTERLPVAENKTTEATNNVPPQETNGTGDNEAARLESILSALDAVESNSTEGTVNVGDNSSSNGSSIGAMDGNVLSNMPASMPPIRTTVGPPKESALVRLAHRIKALETNMSLSSQYLEQLSLHHKRQVEDLQRRLDSLSERQSAVMGQVEILVQRVDAITNTLADIIRERDTWHYKVIWFGQHGIVIMVEVCLFVCLVGVCRWVGSAIWHAAVQTPVRSMLRRRRSLDDVSGRIAAHTRRPSHTALQVSGATHKDLLLVEGKRKTSRTENRKKKRRKREAEEIAAQPPPPPIPDEKLTPTLDAAVLSSSPIGSAVITVNGNAMSSSESIRTDSPSSFIRTATFLRKQRIPRTSSDTASSSSIKVKKPGVIKRFVKKLF